VFRLLARREVSPRTKHSSKRFWREASNSQVDLFGSRCEAMQDARGGLISWYGLGSSLFFYYVQAHTHARTHRLGMHTHTHFMVGKELFFCLVTFFFL
jgi:hypothetical protein